MRHMQRLAGVLFALILITVYAGCAGTEKSRSTGAYLDDKTISTKVKTELAKDPVASATQVQVETYQGVVQLSGFVASDEIKSRSEEIARNTEGVKSVKNNLIVRSDTP